MTVRPFVLNPNAPKFEPLAFSTAYDLEIGAGVGMHAIQYALTNPTRHLIAVEKTSEKFEKMHRRWINHNQPKNLTLVHANILDWLPQTTTDEQIAKCFILYPNPYPKKKQANLRFVNMPFFSLLIEKLKRGGTIELATNESFYFDEAVERIQNRADLKVIESKSLQLDDGYRTHFEKKYLLAGQTCRQITAEKC